MAEAAAVEIVENTQGDLLKPIILTEEELGDYWPGLILGINSVLGTVWWLLSWFVFVKNTNGDTGLKNIARVEVLPLGFFWERFASTGDSYAYMALSMFSNFWVFAIVSLVEMIAWIVYLVDSPSFFGWYVNVIGYWGSIVLMLLPPIFSISHIGLTLEGSITQQPGSYCVFLSVIGVIMWLLSSFLHVLYAERLAAFIATKVPYTEPNYKGIQPVIKICKIPRGSMTD